MAIENCWLIKKKILLTSIIVLAILLRLFYLSSIPAGLDPDEAEFAFNSYTLEKYLKNENNEFLPFQVNTYGNYRPLGLPYIIAISLKFFGNTIFALRLPNAIFGVLSVILIYFFTKTIFKNNKIALLSAFLMSISPWSVFLSRDTAEPIMAMCFVLLLFIFVQKYWTTKKNKYLILIYFSAFIAFFTYTGVLPLIFLLPIGLCLYLYLSTKIFLWKIFLPFLFLIIFPVLFVYKSTPGYLNGRLKQTSLLSEKGQFGIKLVTEEQIRENGYNRKDYQNFITLFFHNMKINTLNNILNNWTKHFSFEYLYFKGGEPNRLQVPGVGVFLLIESIFLIGGVLLMFRHGKFGLLFFSTFIILASFLPAGLTFEEVPSTHRPIFATVGFFLIESYFLFSIARSSIFPKKSPISLTVFSFLFLVLAYQMSVYLHNYLVLSPRHRNWFRHAEMYDIAFFLKKNKYRYNKIYVVKNSVEPVYFYYFFNKLDPMPIILNKTKTHSGSWTDGTITFVHSPCVDFEKSANEKKVLVIERIECQNGGSLIRNILSTDGTPILKILEK